MKFWLFFAATFAAATGVARADDCAHATTQYALNRCAEDAYEAANARLDRTYHMLLMRLESHGLPTTGLASAEHAWLAYRDAECTFQTFLSVGGSMHMMTVAACSRVLTLERVTRLRAYLSCGQGDANCPVPEP